jgi:hypothetical protein
MTRSEEAAWAGKVGTNAKSESNEIKIGERRNFPRSFIARG